MGTILQAACSKCGYQAKLFVGGGLADCEPETAIAAAPHDRKLAAALKEGALFEIARGASLCKNCKKLTVAVDVTYQMADDEPEIHTGGVCPDCGGPLTPFAPDEKSVLCPKCRGTITLSPTGRWD